jgi:exosortase K
MKTQNDIITGNIPYYLSAVGLFVLLKIGFTFADNGDLTFLLKPTDRLVGLLTGSQSVYLADYGFFHFHGQMNFVIEKSCSGFNFWVLCFPVFAYLGLKYFDRHIHKALTVPAALLCSYLLTVFVNASRIVASLVVRNLTVGFFPGRQPLIHEIVGITTCFTFLVLVYYLIEKCLKHIKYAKFT